MTLLKSLLVLPALVLGLNTSKPASAKISLEQTSRARANALDNLTPNAGVVQVVQRKQRIEHLLFALDRVAATALQMKPENAERIEPVVVDLAEQTIDLANERALQSSTTDPALDKLEATVSKLESTLNRLIEPEASL